MVDVTTGELALPIPEDSDPMELLPETIRDMANQLELTAIPNGLGHTATWSAAGGGAVDLGSTGGSEVLYYKTGTSRRRLDVWMKFGGSGIALGSGTWQFLLPDPADYSLTVAGSSATSPFRQAGVATFLDSSTGALYRGLATISGNDNTKVRVVCDPTTAGNAMRGVDATAPFAWATGDELWFGIDYRMAT